MGAFFRILRVTNGGNPVAAALISGWAQLRAELWPEADRAAHASDLASVLSGHVPYAGFLAFALEGAGGEPIGFAESSMRALGANGCETRPVAFLEGLYVRAARRRRGVARALVADVEAWARSRGCSELGSDALLANREGQAVHGALGFTETERVVYFRKRLDRRA